MRVRFGDCVLDTGIRTLTREGKDVALSPKAFRLHGDPVIRTVHRFGYAFSGHVREDDEKAPEVSRCAIRWGSQLVPLASGENVIGRATDVLITLPSTKVSRHHARILVADGRVILEDLGSRNGTYVGERRIESAVELKNGDRIGIGPALLGYKPQYAVSRDGRFLLNTAIESASAPTSWP